MGHGLKTGARVYITAICLAGGAGLASALLSWTSANPWWFVAYCLAALMAAGVSLPLPGSAGRLSASYIFVLASIVDTQWEEAVIVAVVANLAQLYWTERFRSGKIQIAFNVASTVVAVISAHHVYHFYTGIPNTAYRLAAAASVYFIMSSVAVAMVVGLTQHRSVPAVWRKGYLWSLPYYVGGAILAAVIARLGRLWGWEFVLTTIPVLLVVFRVYRGYIERLDRQRKSAEQTASLHLRTIEALALAIEAKDQTTGQHLRRVQVYAREIAKDLGLSDQEQLALQAASILHDIGKLAVPDYIITKPGRLTPEEFDKMKIHPVIGAEILETIGFPYAVAPIVGAHHEKWDGSGYPYGLSGETIPIGARILTCVDCFDALASDRQYRKALPIDEAIDVVRGESGKSFDPRVVEVLCTRYRELETLACKEPIVESKKLSTDLRVARDAAPDAGYQEDSCRRTHVGVKADQPPPSVAGARQEIHALYELLQAVGESLTLSDTLALLAVRIRELVPYDGIAVYIQEDLTLVPRYVNGESYGLFAGLRIPLGQGLSGWVAENHKAILNGNPAVEPGYLDDPSKTCTMASALAVPLEGVGGGIGVLTLYALSQAAFTSDQQRIVEAVAAKLSPVIEAQLLKGTAPATGDDQVTALPGAAPVHVRLEAEIQQAADAGTALTVLSLDLDGFREINHNLGHAAGNRLLRDVASEIQRLCRAGELLGRMGGDEFVLVAPGCAAETAQERIEEFEAAVRQAGKRAGVTDAVAVSIGAASYPADGASVDSLLAAADQRVRRVKRTRRNKIVQADSGLANLARNVSEPRVEEICEAAPCPANWLTPETSGAEPK